MRTRVAVSGRRRQSAPGVGRAPVQATAAPRRRCLRHLDGLPTASPTSRWRICAGDPGPRRGISGREIAEDGAHLDARGGHAGVRVASADDVGGDDVDQQSSDGGRADDGLVSRPDPGGAQIGPVADMIREIAARTNLLALNATIEAAHRRGRPPRIRHLPPALNVSQNRIECPMKKARRKVTPYPDRPS